MLDTAFETAPALDERVDSCVAKNDEVEVSLCIMEKVDERGIVLLVGLSVDDNSSVGDALEVTTLLALKGGDIVIEDVTLVSLGEF